MSIREKITLDDRQYLASWRRIDKQVKQSGATHRQTMGRVNKSTQQAGKQMQWFSKVSARAGQALKYAFGGLAIGAVFALQSALRKTSQEQMAFNQAMNESLAIMGDVDQFTRKRMERTARRVSDEFNIAADKMAQAYFYLASAGLDAEQQIASLPAVAEFAKAGMFDLATATDLATDAQSALGLSVDDSRQNLENMTRVTDVMVKANTLANASVEQFAQSLTNKAAAALKVANKEVEEGVAVLAAYADQGVKGQLAGNALNIVLRDLQNAWAGNEEAMREAGVEVFDQNENFRNMGDIISDLEDSVAGLTPEMTRHQLAQMGFQQRSLIFLQTLMGTSDAIKGYESSLKDAAGTTQEVADRQMKPLTERVNGLWTAFKNAFGPALTTMLEGVVGRLENIADTVDSIFGGATKSQTQRMLEVVREYGDNPELEMRLERQQLLEEGEQLRDELFDEMKGIEVPMELDEKTWWESIKGVFSEMSASNLKIFGGERFLTENLLEAFDAFSGDYDFDSEMFSTDRINAYQIAVEKAQAKMENLTNAVARMKESGADVPDQLIDQIDAYGRQINTLDRVLERYDLYQDALESIEETRDVEVATNEEIAQQQENRAKMQAALWQDSFEWMEKILNFQFRTSDAVGAATLGDGNMIINPEDLESEGDILEAYLDHMRSTVRNFNEEMTTYRNELHSDVISPQQFEESTQRIRESARDTLQFIYNSLRQLRDENDEPLFLTPEIEKKLLKAFEDIGKGAKDAKDETRELGEELRDVADAMDSIAAMADQIGLLSDNLSDALNHASNLVRNSGKIHDLIQATQEEGHGLGVMDFALPTAGALSGAIGMVAGFFDNSESQREQQRIEELTTEMKSLQREIAKNTEALLKEAQIGADVSQKQLEQAEAAFAGIEEIMQGGALKDLMGMDTSKDFVKSMVDSTINKNLLPQLYDLFNQLSETGIEGLEQMDADFFKDYLDTVAGENISGTELWQALSQLLHQGTDEMEGMANVVNELSERLGEFGDSLDGAIERFRTMTKLGLDERQTFETFIEDVKGLVGEDNTITRLLTDIARAESEEDRQDLARQLFQVYQDNPALLGPDLTGNDLQAIIDAILGVSDPEAAQDESQPEYARSVQVSRAITEVQANEVVTLLHSILIEAQGMHNIMRGAAGITETATAPNGGQTGIEAGGNTLDLDITVGRLGVVTDEDIDFVVSEIRTRMEDELKYKAF